VILVGPLNDAGYLKQIHLAVESLKPADRAHIDIRGAVDEVAPYYRAADIFVCTSRIESAPRAISEAMSFGLPILATPVFGIPEMVESDVNALFFEPGATTTLAAHIDHLHASPARRKAMAAASPEVLSKRPDFNAMIWSYAQLLREAQLAT
jgi:glycosyltransferase involved in cell wall biosynthesis